MGKFLEPLKAGLRFGRLTTTGIYKVFQEGNHLRGKDECICDCGKITYVRRNYLYDGRSQSCGCYKLEKINKGLRLKHGDCESRFYKIRDGMICRCNNHKRKDWERYGGRGITVCEERRDYENFKKDMFDKYKEITTIYGERNISIDRINDNEGYSKENCRWSTPKEQANNTRRNLKIKYKDKEYPSLSLLLDELCISDKYKLVRRRLKKGRSIDDAISVK